MNLYNSNNLTLLTDLYELTMIQGYFFYKRNLNVVFDMFFRYQPFNGGYSVFAGLEPLIKTILSFKFTDDDIAYLEKLKLFKPSFLKYLSNFKFNGDIYSVEEGEVVFPKEPLIRVHGNIIEAQIIESILLNIINFQTLIATKTARIVESAKGKAIIEFGLRRAQGVDGAISASRASFIGGAIATSNVLAGKLFDIPVKGTMAHSWVMAFNSELESFKKYAKLYPENTILLIDTYDTLKKGIPSAIKVLKELKKLGIKNFGIRLDSGDLEYLSKQARIMLDKAGLKEAKIVASNELNEHIIEQLVNKKAPIDFFGVGTNLVTAQDSPSFPGVYKLVAKKTKNEYVPSIKVSNNPEKTTNPHIKNILRVYNEKNLMLGDLIFLEKEKESIYKTLKNMEPLTFYHPEYNYEWIKIKKYKNHRILLKNIVKNGKLNYEFPDIKKIQQKTKSNLNSLHPSYKRLLNPHIYKVSLTEKLMKLKINLIKKYR
ncbi:MAG: nicotinate phosphoribosyltransferase [Endomicrobiia bacterium]